MKVRISKIRTNTHTQFDWSIPTSIWILLRDVRQNAEGTDHASADSAQDQPSKKRALSPTDDKNKTKAIKTQEEKKSSKKSDPSSSDDTSSISDSSVHEISYNPLIVHYRSKNAPATFWRSSKKVSSAEHEVCTIEKLRTRGLHHWIMNTMIIWKDMGTFWRPQKSYGRAFAPIVGCDIY